MFGLLHASADAATASGEVGFDVDGQDGTQVEVTTAMMILDSYRALEDISNNPLIDQNKVAITGWSLGGGVALFSAWKPLKEAINKDLKFAAHLSYYPPCIVEPTVLQFSDSPIHLLLGELDDWVPADACIDMVDIVQNKNMTITTYPKSHHSFDRFHGLIDVDDAYSFTDCRLKLTNDGLVRTLDWGFPLSNSILQKSVLAFCADRGATYGGNKKAREHSRQFALEFMNEHLR